jgi:hypothetical protein
MRYARESILDSMRNKQKRKGLKIDTNVDEDDAYLMHPGDFSKNRTIFDSPSKRKHHSLSSSPIKLLNLKPKMQKSVVHAINRIGEDKATFIKFYLMKKPLLSTNFVVYCYTQEDEGKWRPSAREGSLMHCFGKLLDGYILINNFSLKLYQLYAFGGIGTSTTDDLIELNVCETDGKIHWEQVKKKFKYVDDHGKEVSHVMDLGRGGVSQAEFYEIDTFDKSFKTHNVVYYGNGNIVKFSSKKKEFKLMAQYGVLQEARQYHTASVFGKYMVVYGGINKFKKILDTLGVYDLVAQQWKEVKILKNSINRWINDRNEDKYVNFESDSGPGPLYHHRCVPVFFKQREAFWEEYIFNYAGAEDSDDDIQDPIVRMPKVEWQKVDNYLKQEGFYFFGGKSVLGEISNDVWVLKLTDKKISKIAEEIDQKYRKRNKLECDVHLDTTDYYAFLQWEKMEVEGKPPCSRYQH